MGLGLALYAIVTARVLLAVRRRPRFTPDIWVVMGALAIATLAGTELLIAARADRRLPWLTGLLNGAAVTTLAAASLLIVPLAIVDARARAARRYAAARWSFVFPLGMYATAAWTLGRVETSDVLAWIARAFLALAVAAWALTTLGLARRGLSTLWQP